MELKPGDIVGGVYRIERAGPQGGMAQIWRAWHRGLRTWHALKILGPEWAGNAEVWERFVEEGRLQAWHIHPHIVRVTDVVYDEHLTALVMDWVDGADLEDRLEAGPLPRSEAVTWLLQLLDALDLVHGHGVVHRDLKPANLLISASGQLKLTDFGIARTEQGSGTQIGTRMGTPDYMSPEQLRDSSAVDNRSDLYGVGAILFELLTGRIATRESGLLESPPEDLPPDLVGIILTAMQTDPALRYPDAAAFTAALLATRIPIVAVVDDLEDDLQGDLQGDLQASPGAAPIGDHPLHTDLIEHTEPVSEPPRRSWLGAVLLALVCLGLGTAGGVGGAWMAWGDADGDGLGGAADACPGQPEDRDGFEDHDGCPDRDNDNDGIVDALDRCPDVAEDADGRNDSDGCPDEDDDGDGLADDDDGCPTQPEDLDGFEDADGCPEADNDNDGIVDDLDSCPLRPEDGPGLFDADGCPDPAVAVGTNHSCALSAQGTTICWGADDDDRTRSLTGLSAITAAADHTCGLTDAGAARCVGHSDEGEVIEEDGPFSWLDTSERATCGITAQGTISCWGGGPILQGIPTTADFVRLSVGKDHACGIHRGGTLTCWGNDSHDRLVAPAGEFVSVSAGTWHTCGIRPGGEAACWGFDGNGQARAPSGRFSDIDTARFRSCGVRSSGQVQCWGLGFNDPTVDLSLPGGLVRLALSGEHGCGLTDTAEVVCWGNTTDAARPPGPRGLLYTE
ncbi:MAG: hypothetical protein ACI8RZ_005685 [Myxococcota bacterium]|jgi:hypothetical protein